MHDPHAETLRRLREIRDTLCTPAYRDAMDVAIAALEQAPRRVAANPRPAPRDPWRYTPPPDPQDP